MSTALLVAAGGCSGLAATPPSGAQYDVNGVVAEMALRPHSFDPTADAWLYVAGQAENRIDVYDLAQPGTPVVETITQGLDYPTSLAVDSSGTLYAVNFQSNGGVVEYPAGQTSPSLTLQVSNPIGVVVDRRGNIVVSTRNSPPCMLVFRPGEPKPHRKICDTLFSVPSQLVEARAGALYISDNKTGVVVMKSIDAPVQSLHLQGLPQCPTGIALDEVANELFVSGCLGGTQVYALGSTAPIHSLNESIDADNIAGGRVGHHYDVFEPSLHGTTVSIFRARSTDSFKTLKIGTQQTIGIALKPAGVP
jgi:hypothetical protein